MPTYNRVRKNPFGELLAKGLDRAVECFLRQTYENAELLIVNDTPGQSLVMEEPHPRIRIINEDSRYDSLGAKCQRAIVNYVDGEYITRWDDDDISFPWRLESTVRSLREASVVFFSGCYFWSPANQVFFVPGTGMQCDTYARELFTSGKLEYPKLSCGEDVAVRSQCRAGKLPLLTIEHDSYSAMYLYNRSPGCDGHVSSYGMSELAYAEIGRQPIVECEYSIRPQWDRDWVAWIKQSEIPRPLS